MRSTWRHVGAGPRGLIEYWLPLCMRYATDTAQFLIIGNKSDLVPTEERTEELIAALEELRHEVVDLLSGRAGEPIFFEASAKTGTLHRWWWQQQQQHPPNQLLTRSVQVRMSRMRLWQLPRRRFISASV